MEDMSPYYGATAVEYFSGEYSLEPSFPIQVFDYPYEFYTVKDGDTLQNIAYKFYGDSGYWHYIVERNNILNPFKEVVPGLLLKIPKFNG